MLISGRIRLIREDPGMRPRVRVEEEVGRGEAVGAVWALTGGIHDTTALCVRDSELVRMSKVSQALIRLGWVSTAAMDTSLCLQSASYNNVVTHVIASKVHGLKLSWALVSSTLHMTHSRDFYG